jgi:hypothetical protein
MSIDEQRLLTVTDAAKPFGVTAKRHGSTC